MAIGINFDNDFATEDDRDLGADFWKQRNEEVERQKAFQRWRHQILRKANERAHKALEEFLNDD